MKRDSLFCGAPRGDYVQLTVAIQIGQAEIFTRHCVVVHEALTPFFSFRVERCKELDSGFPFAVLTAPTNDDLVEPYTKQIATRQRVTFFQ